MHSAYHLPCPAPGLQPAARAFALSKKFGITAHELDTGTLSVATFRKMLQVEKDTKDKDADGAPSPVYSALSHLVAAEQAKLDLEPVSAQEATGAASAKAIIGMVGSGIKDAAALREKTCQCQMMFKLHHQLCVWKETPSRWIPTNIDCSVSLPCRHACLRALAWF